MKRIIKRTGILLLLLSLLLTGCSKGGTGENEETTPEEVKSVDLNGYTIIRGDEEAEDVIVPISNFYFKLKNEYKLDISFGVDIEVKEGNKEIIFGATNRSTDKNHRYSDYSIDYKDGKLYIYGGSAEAIKAATEWLCSECISEGIVSLEKIPYEYNAAYELENLKICGVALREFGFEDNGKGLTDELRKWAGPKAGLRKQSESGYLMKVVEDKNLYLNEVGVELVGKDLILTASSHLKNPKVVADYLLSVLKNSNGNDITFNKSEIIEMPKPVTSIKDVRNVSAQNVMLSAQAQDTYKVGDEVVFVGKLEADGTVVSCPKFVWSAKTDDGKTYSGEADGLHGKFVIKLPATGVGGMKLKVLVKDENGALISCVGQSEEFDKDPVFSIIIKSADDKPIHVKEIPDCFETTPIVYAVGTDYQIIVPVNKETLMWVEVDGKLFYDEVNGVLRSNTSTHKMTVPQILLDNAGEYKICYRM